MKKIALISGITGQDGSFLAEFLIEKGYEVHGILRRSSSFNTSRIEHLYLDEWVRDMKKDRLVNLHYGDMTDSSSLIRIIQQVQPDEIYNLAAQSHVKVSFDVPEYTADADAIGTLRMLEAVRILGMEKKTKIYQASTSELFGMVQEVPQKETTPFYPRSPYGVAKQYGFWITKNYRESYGMFAVNGILFNHESERRGETFVTRKITLAAARIAQGLQDKLYLGNLDSLRDWGYAKDYVECMWLILQHDAPEDFVIATGEYHTVREFTTLAFKETGVNLCWEGKGVNEKGIDEETVFDERNFKVMFAGAVGEAHGMECNLQAALLTKERKDIKWVIVGDGRRMSWVQQFVKEHGLEETVLTLGRYPSETMPLFFKKADVMLVSLTDSPLFNLYAPAKISSYMAAGRPIIASLNGEGAEVVKDAECGWHVAPGDAQSLAKLVVRLSETAKETLAQKGASGRAFYEENFMKEKCLRNLDEIVGC